MESDRDLIAVGDQLQSAGSRVAEWIKQHQLDVPYEVDMAALELASAVKWWTELRAAHPDNDTCACGYCGHVHKP